MNVQYRHYSIVWRYVEWTHLMRMFILSVNINRMSKQKYGLWKEASHNIFGDRCKEVWEYIGGGGPREFDCGHMLMWLYQMLYVKVLLGVQIAWSTMHRRLYSVPIHSSSVDPRIEKFVNVSSRIKVSKSIVIDGHP